MWTLVLPVRTTPREEAFFKRTFPVMMSLRPDETIVVVDSPWGDPSKNPIPKLAQRYGAKVLEVDRNPNWKFHQAYARRCGYEEAKHDLIFTMDVDSTPTWNILKGYRLMQRQNMLLVSFRKLLKFTPTLAVQNSLSMARSFLSQYRFTGVYWLNRPLYLELMPREIVSQIRNGEDTLLVERMLKSNYDYRFLRDIGSISHDIENEQKPWRDFLQGIWIWTHRKIKPPEQRNKFGKLKLINYTIQIIVFNKAHVVKGIIWARDHSSDPLVQQVGSLTKWKELVYLGDITRGYGRQ